MVIEFFLREKEKKSSLLYPRSILSWDPLGQAFFLASWILDVGTKVWK